MSIYKYRTFSFNNIGFPKELSCFEQYFSQATVLECFFFTLHVCEFSYTSLIYLKTLSIKGCNNSSVLPSKVKPIQPFH